MMGFLTEERIMSGLGRGREEGGGEGVGEGRGGDDSRR